MAQAANAPALIKTRWLGLTLLSGVKPKEEVNPKEDLKSRGNPIFKALPITQAKTMWLHL